MLTFLELQFLQLKFRANHNPYVNFLETDLTIVRQVNRSKYPYE